MRSTSGFRKTSPLRRASFRPSDSGSDDVPTACFHLEHQEENTEIVPYCSADRSCEWAVTFICEFELLSATRIMSSAEFIEMITAEAQLDDDDTNSFADREQTDLT